MDEDLGSTRWFGPNWGAPACRPDAQILLPAHTECACGRMIGQEESGLRFPHIGPMKKYSYYHLDCFLESIGVDPQAR